MTKKGQKSKGWRNSEVGAAGVEFAVIVTLLLVILLGILEFAFIFFQKHFVANAAREGLRVGIIADNYDTYSATPGCSDTLNRYCVVEMKGNDYLSTLYDMGEPGNKITQIKVDSTESPKSLRVTAQVENFFPQLLSGLVPSYAWPETLTYTVTGIYEDPEEHDNEE